MPKPSDDTEQSAADARRDARAVDAVPAPPVGRLNGRTLVMMRWIAISGQLTSIAVITELFKIALPIAPMLATVGASILLNVVVMAQRGSQQRLTDQDATFYLVFDTLELTLLLYLTGGLVNPFTILLLAPLTVGAAILSLTNICLLTLINQLCFAVLALWHFPLPWSGETLALPPLYLAGVWGGLAMASLMLASYVFRVAHESRRISDALSASQMALAREQRLSALGGLAAAAAHELGTPLGTIVMVAGELARDVATDSPLAEDIALLRSQSLRCRDILAELARRPEADGGDPFEKLPLTALVDAASTSHRATAAILRIRGNALDGSPEPVVRRRPEIIHGVGNLLQNALQFAEREVEVIASWDADSVCLAIADDGPGFPSHLLSRIGEPYISARADRTGHMGLGIFIAETLLGRTGAVVEFGNRRQGGAEVLVRWDRRALDREEA
ncbi:MAG: ActS/PrrB/RegB family redox-sensitive histidine kinase [Rhodospirillaceae bacterium]